MYSITKNGKPLDEKLYTIDEKAKTFATAENGLVLDFRGEYGWTFKTGSYCTFTTSFGCTFTTGFDCTFDTDYGCTFNTGSSCTFKTGEKCVVVRRDVYEVIELDGTKKTRLRGLGVAGYTLIEDEPTLSGKKVEVKVDGRVYTATID